MTSHTPNEFLDLRDLFQAQDPVPEHVTAAAYAALRVAHEFRELDAGRLELISDSAESPDFTPARSRSGGLLVRTLTFAVPGGLLGVDFVATAPRLLCATGMVIDTPSAGDVRDFFAGSVELRHPKGRLAGELDEHGAFRLDDVPSGPLSVVYRPRGCPPTVSDWMVC